MMGRRAHAALVPDPAPPTSADPGVRRRSLALLDALEVALLVYSLDGWLLQETAAAAALMRAEAEEDCLRSGARRLAMRSAQSRAGSRRVAASAEVVTARATYRLRAVAAPAAVFGPGGHVVVTITSQAAPPHSDRALRERFRLTAREVEVARLMARGLRNAEIAERLLISSHTAERHAERVLRKLRLPTRAAVAAFLAATGL